MNEALGNPWLPHAIINEMQVLEHNSTPELVLISRKKTIGCRYVYAIKVGLVMKLIASKLDWWAMDILKSVTLIIVVISLL